MANYRELIAAVADFNTNGTDGEIEYTNEEGNTEVVTAYDLNEMKNKYERPDLPALFFMPMEEYGNQPPGVPELQNAGSGRRGADMSWNITALYLHSRVGQKRGFMDVLPDLVRFISAYSEIVLDHAMPVSNSGVPVDLRLQSFVPSSGTYGFPIGSDNQYYGADFQLIYNELLNPGG